VKGGDATHIREHLLDVVREEVDTGREPDFVVVVTGGNDLKRFTSVDQFRSNLSELVDDIRRISPLSRVVFPSLPTTQFVSQSSFIVFPLKCFFHPLIKTWDRQKLEWPERRRGTSTTATSPMNKWKACTAKRRMHQCCRSMGSI